MTNRRSGPGLVTIGVVVTATLYLVLAPWPSQAQSGADPLRYDPSSAYPNEAPGDGSASTHSMVPGKMSKRPPCRCQNYGKYLYVGDVACIKTNKGPRMARCILKGNNTMWEFLTDLCPVS